MIEHASLIAICIAGIALFALVYVALFMRSDEDDTSQPHQPEHFKRWEDRL